VHIWVGGIWEHVSDWYVLEHVGGYDALAPLLPLRESIARCGRRALAARLAMACPATGPSPERMLTTPGGNPACGTVAVNISRVVLWRPLVLWGVDKVGKREYRRYRDFRTQFPRWLRRNTEALNDVKEAGPLE
jgi:hypothetical protein